MPTRLLVFIGMTVGSIIGGYIPTLFGAGLLSYSSAFFSAVGAILGVWVGFKLSNF